MPISTGMLLGMIKQLDKRIKILEEQVNGKDQILKL